MKKRKLNSKLFLNKEKIAFLNNRRMSELKGGSLDIPTTYQPNNTRYCDTTTIPHTSELTCSPTYSEENCGNN
jgi:hypothetical protein